MKEIRRKYKIFINTEELYLYIGIMIFQKKINIASKHKKNK